MTTETLNTGSNEMELLGFTPKTSEPSGPERSYDTPLKDFWCKPAGFTVKKGTSTKGREWIRVNFRGTDIEVIDSEIPYPYPTSEFGMFYSDPETTPAPKPGQGSDEWTVICQSMREIMGGDREDMLNVVWGGQVRQEDTTPPYDCPRVHCVKVPTNLRVGPNDNNSKWHDEVVGAWQVVEIEGVGKLESSGISTANGSQPEDMTQYVLGLADGKTEDAFNAEATNDSKILSQPSIMTQIGEKTFLSNMVMLQMLTKDGEGVYHKKA